MQIRRRIAYSAGNLSAFSTKLVFIVDVVRLTVRYSVVMSFHLVSSSTSVLGAFFFCASHVRWQIELFLHNPNCRPSPNTAVHLLYVRLSLQCYLVVAALLFHFNFYNLLFVTSSVKLTATFQSHDERHESCHILIFLVVCYPSANITSHRTVDSYNVIRSASVYSSTLSEYCVLFLLVC